MSVAWSEGQEVPARAVLAMHDNIKAVGWAINGSGLHRAMHDFVSAAKKRKLL
jgi:hypothetical protein